MCRCLVVQTWLQVVEALSKLWLCLVVKAWLVVDVLAIGPVMRGCWIGCMFDTVTYRALQGLA
jgi:hypothetical protein